MKLRWALRFLLFVAGMIGAIALVLRTEWAGQELCRRGVALARGLSGQPVTVQHCSIDPLGTRVEIQGLRVGAPGGPPLLAARRLLAELAPLQAFGARFVLSRLEIDAPEVTVNVPPSPADEEPPRHGCLAPAGLVRVDALVIRDGRADVTLGGGKLISARGVSLDGSRDGTLYALQLGVAGGGYEDPQLHLPLSGLAARVRLDVAAESAQVDELSVSAAGSGLSITGAVRELCRPQPDVLVSLRAALPEIAAVLPGTPPLRGAAALDVRVTGDAGEPHARGTLRLTDFGVNDLDPGDLALRFHADRKEIGLEELEWPVEKGKALVSGTILLDDRLTTTVDARTEGMEFHRLMARLPIKSTPVMMVVDSRHHLEGRLRGGFQLEGRSELDLRDFRVRNVPWHEPGGEVIVATPRARIDTSIRIDPGGVHLPDARIRIGDSAVIEADALLSFSDARGLTIRASTPGLDLALAGSRIASVPVAGVARIDALIEGPYPRPLIEGDVVLSRGKLFAAELGDVSGHVFSDPSAAVLEFREVAGRRGETDYQSEVKLLLEGESQMDARLEVKRGGRLRDVFEATSGLMAPMAWLASAVDGQVTSASAHLHGPMARLSGDATVSAGEARFLDRPFDLVTVDLRLDSMQRVVFERAEAIRSGGRLLGGGELDLSRPDIGVSAALRGEGVPLRELLGEFGKLADLGGTVAADLTLGGTTGRLDLKGTLTGTSLSASSVALPEARLSLSTREDGQVDVTGPVCGAGNLAAVVQLAPGLPFEAAFDLLVLDASRYAPQGVRLGGDLRGKLTATGTLADVTASSGTVRLDRVALSLGDDYRVTSQGEVAGSFDGASFAIRQLRLQGENTELQLAGNRSAAGGLDLQASGTLDARLLDTLVPQIESASGQVEIKASMTGTAAAPVLVGSAEVRRAGFHVRPLPITVRGMSAKLAFSQNQVIVEDASMSLNGGQMRARGTVSLRDWAPTTMDLDGEGKRISWQKPEEWPAILSGTLHLGGEWPSALVLGGRLTVDRLRYTKDMDLERAALDFRRRAQLLTSGNDPEWIRLDIDLLGGEDMRVDNNLVRARLQFVAPPGVSQGKLQVVGTNARIGLLGSVEILEGVAFFRGNEYRIQHGVVDFDERDQIDPAFDITAETTVRDYRVDVHALGRLGDGTGKAPYTLQLSSDPSLAQADIVTLLTFGFTSVDLDRSGGNAAAGAGVAAEALLAVSGLEEHVRRFLPRGKLLQDPDISLTSQYSSTTNQLEPMAVFEARLITENLRLKAAAPISTIRGRSAAAEYRVSDHLSTRLIWEDQETVSAAGDLGLDLKLRWEWE